jgi:hypothetical protein
MSHDDPFTLDLFGNTALSSGLGVGVTAFSTSFADSPADDDPPPVSPSPAMPIAAVAQPLSDRLPHRRARTSISVQHEALPNPGGTGLVTISPPYGSPPISSTSSGLPRPRNRPR